jgi:hypothetical protein
VYQARPLGSSSPDLNGPAIRDVIPHEPFRVFTAPLRQFAKRLRKLFTKRAKIIAVIPDHSQWLMPSNQINVYQQSGVFVTWRGSETKRNLLI